jgi:hypothetical protein
MGESFDRSPSKRTNRSHSNRRQRETEPQPKPSGFPVWLLAVIIPLLVLFLVCGVGIGILASRYSAIRTNDSGPTEPKVRVGTEPTANVGTEFAVKVRADELFKSYSDDIVAADKKYTGQEVELEVVSCRVQKDGAGRYYLVAAPQARFEKRPDRGARVMSTEEYQRELQEAALNTTYLPGVILYLDPQEAGMFSGLGNKKATVRGRCRGTTKDKTTEPSCFVTVERVRLVAEKP